MTRSLKIKKQTFRLVLRKIKKTLANMIACTYALHIHWST